jgi:hypothetical protein
MERREARAGDGDVVKLILSRFDDLTEQIKDVRQEQDHTNAHLATLNGRTRKVEIEQACLSSRLKTLMVTLTTALAVVTVAFAAANFLKLDITDLVRLVGT